MKKLSLLNKEDTDYSTSKQKILDQYGLILNDLSKELDDARWEHRHGTDQYIKDQIDKVKAEYEPKLAKFTERSAEEKEAISKARDEKISLALSHLNTEKQNKANELSKLSKEDEDYAKKKQEILDKYNPILKKCKKDLVDAKWDEERALRKEYAKKSPTS